MAAYGGKESLMTGKGAVRQNPNMSLLAGWHTAARGLINSGKPLATGFFENPCNQLNVTTT